MLNKYHSKNERVIYAQSRTKFLSHIAKKAKANLIIPTICNNKGDYCFSDRTKSEAFLTHFSSIYNNIPSTEPSLPNQDDILFDYGLIFITDSLIYEEMRKIVPKIYKSPDYIPPLLLRKCALSLSKPIAYILRRSYFLGAVPELWKRAIITPVYKGKGVDKNKLDSYRPVALTSPIAKLAEKLVLDEIKPYLKIREAIPDFQHGFMDKKSVVTLLLEEIDDFTEALESKQCIDLILFDFKKAFDTVNLDLLLNKLSNYGIGGDCLNWLKSFLTHRTISVSIRNSKTGSISINAGVAQGSILGPYLFNFFVSDILTGFTVPRGIKLKQYADDLQAYSIFNPDEAHIAFQGMQSVIQHISSWSEKNLLALSHQKIETIHLGNNNPNLNYHINEYPITSVDSARNLGLIINKDLKWNSHIKGKCSAAIRRWFNIARATRLNDYKALTLLYTSLVRPILEFPSVIFNPINTGLIAELEKVQRRITRHIIFKSYLMDKNIKYEDRLKILNLDTLQSRRIKLDLMYYFKILKGEICLEHSKIPKVMLHITTRNQAKIAHNRFARLLARRQSFFIRTPKCYTRLPSYITDSSSSIEFNVKLKKFVLDDQFFM